MGIDLFGVAYELLSFINDALPPVDFMSDAEPKFPFDAMDTKLWFGPPSAPISPA